MNSASFCNILRIDVRESRRGNKEWKIQKNCQHWKQNTQDSGQQQEATRIPLKQYYVTNSFSTTKFCTD